jgi:hypothetical protein
MGQSRTIKPIESSGAVLAALCIAGLSPQAHASTVTVNLNLNYDTDLYTNIAIDSMTPQFYYDAEASNVKDYFGTQSSGEFASNGLSGTDQINSGLTYAATPGGLKVAGLDGLFTGYLQLSWFSDSNVQEYGYATFTAGDLTSITGNDISVTLSSTPLPASWALFVGGLGMLGLAAQRRRRRRRQPA